MTFKISKIEDEDREKAYRFCLGIFEEMGWDKKFAYGLEDLKKTFGGLGEAFFLAKEKGKVVASAGLKKLTDQEALIKRFYVAKDFRGKGLAGLMLEKIKDFAKEKNYKIVFVDIFQSNERAKKFFQKQGFVAFEASFYHN